MWLCEQQRKHVCQERAGQGADQLEEEGKAHDKGVGGQEVLLAPDHEGAHCQVLPSWSCLGDLQPTTCSVCYGWTCHVCHMQSTNYVVLTSQCRKQLTVVECWLAAYSMSNGICVSNAELANI